MKCDICRNNPAVIFVQQVSKNNSIELHLCEACAQQRGYSVTENKIDISLGGLFSDIQQNSEKDIRCTRCNFSLSDIQKRKKTGCADCYKLFGSNIIALLRNEGVESAYTGPLPKKIKGFTPITPDPEKLKQELQKAIETEDYELAAYYRDRIRMLGGIK